MFVFELHCIVHLMKAYNCFECKKSNFLFQSYNRCSFSFSPAFKKIGWFRGFISPGISRFLTFFTRALISTLALQQHLSVSFFLQPSGTVPSVLRCAHGSQIICSFSFTSLHLFTTHAIVTPSRITSRIKLKLRDPVTAPSSVLACKMVKIIN